jgi:hypothetical protein
MPRRLPFTIGAFLLWAAAFIHGAYAQSVDLGVITGGNLTDDFRPTSQTFLNASVQATNASKWLMLGPSLQISFGRRLSIEADAIHRNVRSRQLTTLFTPFQLPSGITIGSFGPFLRDLSEWNLVLLGKYRIPNRHMKPFFELGPSFVPRENLDQIGITAGAGEEIPLGFINLAPALRYNRWVNNDSLGGVRNQFQFVVRAYERPASQRPTLAGHPISLGIITGMSLTKLLRDTTFPSVELVSESDTRTAIAGIMFDGSVVDRLSVEVDGLYRATHLDDGLILPDGSIQSGERSAVITWEFPILAKFRIPMFKAHPILEAGPSLRMIGHGLNDNHSHLGFTAGLGVAARIPPFSITPTIRYTRWAIDRDELGREPIPSMRRDQLELLVGFSF